MSLARTALALALLMPAPVQARGLNDTHFQTGGCFVRNYSKQHLASHADQLVRHISLSPVPMADPAGVKLMNLMVNLRGSDEYYSGIAYCKAKGPSMVCRLEGDGGGFTLDAAKDGALRLSVAKSGLHFEGQTNFISIAGTSGDDRVFVLPNVSSDQCN